MDIDVIPVLLNTSVPNVQKTLSEPFSQIVDVLLDIMMMVLTLYVYLVDGNVKPVLVMLITVLIVKKTEMMLTPQNVHVNSLLDIMKSHYKLIAHHVPPDVTPVLIITPVLSVKPDLTELVSQNVHVKTDGLNKD